MTTLLPASDATNAAATEGDVKDFLTNLRDYMADFLGTDSTNKGAALALLGSALNGSIDKTSAYTVVSADRGKVINCTGTFTVNVQAAATLGDGFVFAIRNASTGTITVDPNLSEQIDGKNTVSVPPRAMKVFYCTGTAFSEIGGATPPHGIVVATSSGNFTVPDGVFTIKVKVQGPGGNGAGTSGLGALCSGGGGGGAGGYAEKVLSVTPGDVFSYVIGSVGSACTFTGTFGTLTANSGSSVAANSNTGAVGGTATGGDINITGGRGGSGGGADLTGSSGIAFSGGGASSLLGSGGAVVFAGTTGRTSGLAGTGYGSGGSGHATAYTSALASGGAGAPGVVIIEY